MTAGETARSLPISGHSQARVFGFPPRDLRSLSMLPPVDRRRAIHSLFALHREEARRSAAGGHFTTHTHIRTMKLDPTYLSTRSRKVDDIDETRKLYKEAAKLMRQKKGVGLAANQVGHNERWFVWQHGMVINPEIISKTGSTPSKEGCLSFPGRTTTVRRAKIVEVRYIDEQGKSKEKVLSGFPAIVFQHEFDHLNGVCLF